MDARSKGCVAAAIIAGGIAGVVLGILTAYVGQSSSVVSFATYPGVCLLGLIGLVPHTHVGEAWPRLIPLMWANAGAWLFFGALAGGLTAARRLRLRQSPQLVGRLRRSVSFGIAVICFFVALIISGVILRQMLIALVDSNSFILMLPEDLVLAVLAGIATIAAYVPARYVYLGLCGPRTPGSSRQL